MENKSHALMAGLFTLIFVLAAVSAIWWFTGSRELTHTYWLETRGNLTGLNLEAQVRYRGIRAGKVLSIQPDPVNPAVLLVEISLGRKYRLTDKTTAKLNQQGITGLAYVMLEDGEAAGKPLDPEASPPPRIAIQPGLMDNLAQQAEMIAKQVQELTTRLNRLLDERNVKNVSKALENLAAASEEMPQMMAAMRSVLSPDNLKRLNALLVHLEKTAGEAAPLTTEARVLVKSMSGLASRFEHLTDNAGTLGERLNSETLPRAEALMADVGAATRRLDRLLDTLNATPQAILFGAPHPRPGPGEAGYTAPVPVSRSAE
ncbi:MAG: MlaD family protein [Rhodocyclaceae bacterium]|nr:MlaD family protein [Rhodocyclaceae bacterium]MDZ4214216.1 MlaD family protein [Rhodocyclaceae bacterium]